MALSNPWKSAFILAVALCLTATACDDDDAFRDAPRAEASQSSYQAGAAGQAPGGLGPVSGMELPPGHPPIGQDATAATGGAQPSARPQLNLAEYGTVGPIRWTAPDGWEPQQPGGEMRLAQYQAQGPSGVEPAELTVFTFGPGGGGGVEANLQRWSGQFTNGPQAVIEEIDVNGLTVHTFDASGSYDAGMAMGGGAAVDDLRMLAAIVDTSVGLYFFRLLGPKASVDEHVDAFAEFVQSFRLGD